MIRCPYCGSTAQVKLTWEEPFAEKDTEHIREFECGCGCVFEATYTVSNIKILNKPD